MNSAHVRYAIKIWLTSVVLSPVVLVVWDLFFTTIRGDSLVFIMYAMIYGLILSIPNGLLLTLGTKYIFKICETEPKKRIWTQLLVLVLLTFLFFLIFGQDSSKDFTILKFLVAYMITLTFGVWYYSIDVREKTYS